MPHMSESIENQKPVDKYIEGAIRDNDEFLAALDSAQTPEDIKDVIREFTRVDGEGEKIVFQIIASEDGEVDAKTFSEEELLKAVDTLAGDATTDTLAVDEWFDHSDINAALKRVLNLS